jgi:hypothetical protein
MLLRFLRGPHPLLAQANIHARVVFCNYSTDIEGKIHFGNLDVDRTIILKYILKGCGVGLNSIHLIQNRRIINMIIVLWVL